MKTDPAAVPPRHVRVPASSPVPLRGRAEGRTAARRKVTAAELARRAFDGLLKPLIHRGEHVATGRKADNSALLRHLAQLARAARAELAARGRSRGFAEPAASTGDER